MAGACLILFLLAAPGGEATVEPLEGQPLHGRLVELSGERIVIENSSGKQTLDPKQLQSVQLDGVPIVERPQIWVDLIDSSLLPGRSFQSAGGKANVETLQGERIELPTRSVRAVRFLTQTPEIAAMWQDLLKLSPGGDMVVLRKSGTREVEEEGKAPRTVTETVLDQLEGTILEVTPAGAKFDFDGDKIDVKREKMEGIIFLQPVKRMLPSPVCRLKTTDGSIWSVRSLELKGEVISLTTTSGVNHSLALTSLSQIDFGIGNVLYLADMEQELNQGEISFQPKNMLSSFKQLAAPRKNKSAGGEALSIHGTKFAKGLSLHSRTRLDVRVPEGYRQFRAVAGVDDAAGPTASFQLKILGDNKEVFSKQFSAEQSAEPLTIELNLTGVRRLTVVVEEGAGQDFGDTLVLANARLTK
ncbi:MAG: NPCBM/NEW2 domain-containing protein [Planctomycetales bacterium]|nr:NPCBM/NEW2 domain-containing protein [Planctomycetales bacterium]